MMTKYMKRQTQRVCPEPHLAPGGERQRHGLGYVRSRQPTKPRAKTVDFVRSPKALSCFYDLICHLYCVVGSQLEICVDGFPVPTFRAFKRVWIPGQPVYGYWSGTSVFRYRLCRLPLGRVLGLRALRRLVNSSSSHRSAKVKRKFVSGGFVVPSVPEPVAASVSKPRAFWSSLEGVESDPRVAGSHLESPAVARLRSLPRRSEGQRFDLPASQLPFREVSSVFAAATESHHPDLPPQMPVAGSFEHSGLADFVVGSALARSAPVRYSKRFEVPSGVLKHFEPSSVDAPAPVSWLDSLDASAPVEDAADVREAALADSSGPALAHVPASWLDSLDVFEPPPDVPEVVEPERAFSDAGSVVSVVASPFVTRAIAASSGFDLPPASSSVSVPAPVSWLDGLDSDAPPPRFFRTRSSSSCSVDEPAGRPRIGRLIDL